MLIVFSCANCGRKFEKDESLAGKKGRCNDCGHVFLIPTPSGRASPAPARASGRLVAGGDTGRPSSTLSSPAAPTYAEAVQDPYGLDDLPAAQPEPAFPTAAFEDDEIALPRRIAPASSKPKKGRSSRRTESGGFFGGLPGIVYLIVLTALGVGFLSMLVHPRIGAYVFAVSSVLSFLVLLIYGFVGVALLPFRDSVLTGILCWVCPPYLLGYVYREWDTMKGVFLSLTASFGVAIFMAIAAPAANTMRHDMPPKARNQRPAAPPAFADGPPVGFPGPTAPPFSAPRFAPPPGFQPPAPVMSNSITLIVKGLTDLSAGKDFSDKLTELVVKVSGGYTLSSTGGAGWPTYSIAMQNSLDVKAFADQITWARVTRISGQTIEIDASAQ
jgi:DNA-directed RNA polymerase subunit RPC12/RpoP